MYLPNHSLLCSVINDAEIKIERIAGSLTSTHPHCVLLKAADITKSTMPRLDEQTSSLLYGAERHVRRVWNGFVDFALRENVLEVALGLMYCLGNSPSCPIGTYSISMHRHMSAYPWMTL